MRRFLVLSRFLFSEADSSCWIILLLCFGFLAVHVSSIIVFNPNNNSKTCAVISADFWDRSYLTTAATTTATATTAHLPIRFRPGRLVPALQGLLRELVFILWPVSTVNNNGGCFVPSDGGVK